MILVTGAAGFIGSNFVKECLSNPDERVVSLDQLTYAGNLSNLEFCVNNPAHIFVKGDINDEEKVSEILEEYKPNKIVNFAAESHVDRSINSPEIFFQTNVLGTFRLLEASRKYFEGLPKEKKEIFRILHISTDEVYGSLTELEKPFNEENRFKPNSPYSASKASSDHIARSYFKTFSLPIMISNCSNNYGPYQHPEKLIPLTILNLLEDKEISVYGDGKQIRDWLYVEDHCRAIKTILDNGDIGEVYNVGGNNEMQNIQVIEIICDLLEVYSPRKSGKEYKDLIKFVKDRPGHDTRYAINNNKIKEKLSWIPNESFESGIQKTLQWYLTNKEWVDDARDSKHQAWINEQYTN